MKKFPRAIINGDDFGYSKGVNQGIIKAYEGGILTSTSAIGNILRGNESLSNLTNKSGVQKPPIGIGAHLNLTFGKPCLPELWGNKDFTRPYKGTGVSEEWQEGVWEKYFTDYPRENVKKEFFAQIKRIENLGNIDHIDSHISVASLGTIKDVYEDIAKELSISTRAFATISENTTYGGVEFLVDKNYASWAREKGIKTVDSQDMTMIHYYNENDPIAAFCKVLATIKNGEVREFMFHPSIDDSHGAWRMVDLKILTSKKVKQAIKKLNITLTTYKESAF